MTSLAEMWRRNRSSHATRVALLGCAVVLIAVLMSGCGRPDPADRYVRPEQVMDFSTLFSENCSGCHGAAGQFGPAPPLADPWFLALVSDDELEQIVTNGRTGTLMPPFAVSQGGELTPEQIKALVTGLRKAWGTEVKGADKLPAHSLLTGAGDAAGAGDADRGASVFAKACAECHGKQGQGGDQGAINDPAFLGLVSPQLLRRIIITGRSDLGMPAFGFVGDAGSDTKPLTPEQIADLLALFARWRESAETEIAGSTVAATPQDPPATKQSPAAKSAPKPQSAPDTKSPPEPDTTPESKASSS